MDGYRCSCRIHGLAFGGWSETARDVAAAVLNRVDRAGVGSFGGEALSVLLGLPFWVVVLIVLAVQGTVGLLFGYELIHRVQAVLTVGAIHHFRGVRFVKLVGGHEIISPSTVSGADLVGAFVLEATIAFSLAVSWASHAADFRSLPTR